MVGTSAAIGAGMMYRQFLLVSALGVVTSCVPSEHAARTVASTRPRALDSRSLLQALALRVPDDAVLAAATATPRFAARIASAPPFLAAARSADDASRATDCLTQAVYYEARSEPLDGQRAVAQVVLNRVRDRAFPKSVCGVVYQRGTRSSGCQFTFTCDGALMARREPHAWERARAVAEAALSGSVYAPVGAAVFYHTQAVSPWWAPSLSRIGSIGAHIFYRWHDALARSLSFHQGYSGLEPATGGSAPAPFAPEAAFPMDLVQQAGVTIHREHAAAMPATGASMTAGVRIHRGMTPPQSPAETMAADGEPADRT